MAAYRLWMQFVLCSGLIGLVEPFAEAQTPPDLTTITLEELMNVRVTTVSKREQPLSKAAAAVYVITQEEIRRSGAENLADALRLAPGVEVAQISSNAWAISIRGFNSQFANKLLVLIDGRTVYSPTYSGVFWNEQDLMLEDIDRIEVIRGPGATLWGTNAVNGVINIITLSSNDTQGTLVEAGGGSYQHYSTSARYGGKAGTHGTYRLYATRARRTDYPTQLGTTADDGSISTRGGFRSDWTLTANDFLTVQGDGSGGQPNDFTVFSRLSAPFPGYDSFNGGNLLTRWRHTSQSGSELRLQVYYEHARESYPGVIDVRHDSFDIDLQHNLTLGKRHDVVWGGTFRNVCQRTRGSFYAQLVPPGRTLHTFSGFVQDDIDFRHDSLHLIVGSKFESNEFSGVEIQPTIRLLFTPSSRQAVWAAVSRAMRNPSEAEASVRYVLPVFSLGPPGMIAMVFGNPHGRSEELISYEAGYRAQATRHLSIDMAGFYGRYHHLSILNVDSSVPPPPNIIPLTIEYVGAGKTYGFEAAVGYSPTKWWKITGAYNWLHSVVPTNELAPLWAPSTDPEHQFQIHSLFSLPGSVEIDSHLYFTGALPAVRVPQYTRADVRLGWRSTNHLEWSVTGQNLLDSAHPEFFTGIAGAPVEVRRSIYGKVTWRF